jgi:hypothetical protein
VIRGLASRGDGDERTMQGWYRQANETKCGETGGRESERLIVPSKRDPVSATGARDHGLRTDRAGNARLTGYTIGIETVPRNQRPKPPERIPITMFRMSRMARPIETAIAIQAIASTALRSGGLVGSFKARAARPIGTTSKRASLCHTPLGKLLDTKPAERPRIAEV